MKISPVFSLNGKERILAGLSLPRNSRFIFLERALPMKTTERSYFLPSTDSFKSRKSNPSIGGLLLVLLRI